MNPFLIFLYFTLRAAEGYRSRCFFPRAWHGEYFHLGYNSPLVVVNSSISGKGRCIENFGSHFVMEDEEYGEKCWRCMTMYRKHQNVLSLDVVPMRWHLNTNVEHLTMSRRPSMDVMQHGQDREEEQMSLSPEASVWTTIFVSPTLTVKGFSQVMIVIRMERFLTNTPLSTSHCQDPVCKLSVQSLEQEMATFSLMSPSLHYAYLPLSYLVCIS